MDMDAGRRASSPPPQPRQRRPRAPRGTAGYPCWTPSWPGKQAQDALRTMALGGAQIPPRVRKLSPRPSKRSWPAGNCSKAPPNRCAPWPPPQPESSPYPSGPRPAVSPWGKGPLPRGEGEESARPAVLSAYLFFYNI